MFEDIHLIIIVSKKSEIVICTSSWWQSHLNYILYLDVYWLQLRHRLRLRFRFQLRLRLWLRNAKHKFCLCTKRNLIQFSKLSKSKGVFFQRFYIFATWTFFFFFLWNSLCVDKHTKQLGAAGVAEHFILLLALMNMLATRGKKQHFNIIDI